MPTATRAWVPALALVALITVPPSVHAQDADVVVEWNRILQDTLAVPGALPPTVFPSRPYALLHVAVFDALNSIDYAYTPYAARVDAPEGASREAAAAQAAHDVLASLFPNRRATFDVALAATLSRVPSKAGSDGARVGAEAARVILELRATDGWNRVPPQYLLPSLAGYWQPTPPANAVATFTHYPDVQGFVIADGRRFLMEPPPALTSQRYATDFNEAKALGSATSSIRTSDETLTARIWGTVGYSTSTFAVWSNVIRDLARARGLTGLQIARIYALVHIGAHDAFLTSFTGKFLYGLWRPVTAIRDADRDGNAATDADPNWLPLIPTPPYPTYPGNMACSSGLISRTLTRLFGQDNVPFTIRWTGVAPNADVTRSYNGFRQAADEAARSRIVGGIHFTFDTTASFGVCTALADYIVDNTLRARFP